MSPIYPPKGGGVSLHTIVEILLKKNIINKYF